MRAAVFVGPGQPLEVRELKPLPPGPNDVVVRVLASGVCHTDLSVTTGVVPMMPNVILGHEGAGVVEAVGASVTRVKVGDRVIASFVPACSTCWHCRHDESHLCATTAQSMMVPRATLEDDSPVLGLSGLGTFADVMTVSETAVVPIESELPDAELALIGCAVTTGVGAALNTAGVRPGATVAVIGCGGVGQAVIQGARIAGASRIFAIDPVELKRKSAEGFGATDLIDPAVGDPVTQVRDLTGGLGVDYAFEVIGLAETALQAYAVARRGGTAVLVGVPALDVTLPLSVGGLVFEAKHVIGCVYGSAQVGRDFDRFVSLAEAGRLDLGGLVSRTIALDDINDALAAMQAGEVIRTVITP